MAERYLETRDEIADVRIPSEARTDSEQDNCIAEQEARVAAETQAETAKARVRELGPELEIR